MSFNKETGMYEGYIYLLTNIVNNKKYVGQTTRTVKERVWEHFNKKKPYPISLAVQKYGKENFSWKGLYCISASSKKELIQLLNKQEILCIQQYDSLCGHNGYNVDKGGGQASYFKKPVCQYDFYFNFIKKYDSAMDANRETGINFGDISKCCNRKTKSAGGYYWCFDGEKINITNNKKIKNRPVVKYDMQGNQLEIYDCVNNISKDKKLNNRIRNCTNGSCNSVNGYVYRHYGDDFNKYPVYDKNNKLSQSRPRRKKKRTFVDYVDSKALKKVDAYDLNGNFIKTYSSMILASEETNSPKESISNCCRHKIITCNNLVFRYHNEPFDLNLSELSEKVNDYSRKIIQYNVFGEIEREFLNIQDLSNELNISKGDIYKHLTGKRFSIQNKIYRFKGDDFNKYPIYIFGIEQYDMNGKFIKRWESCGECEEKLGLRKGSVSKAINRKTSCDKYIFIKYGDKIFRPSSTTKSVIKYDLQMNVVDTFETIEQARINANYQGTGFKRVLDSNNNFYNGFYWIVNESNYCK